MNSPLDSRRRSAETKRQRTRALLLAAAGEHFTARGWQATRVEDIARDAGVSVATAFNHFSKHSLLGHVYIPLFEPLITAARADIESDADALDALCRHVRDLSTLGRTQQTLTAALLAAVLEQTVNVNGSAKPGDENDVRNIVPFPAPMIELIGYGQRTGRFRAEVSSIEVGAYHTNGLMLRILTKRDESATATAEFVLDQMVPPLLGG